jgi:hypothetical protein
MSFGNEYVLDRLRVAEQDSIQRGSQTVFEELQQFITPEKLAKGVNIRLGGDRLAFKNVIDALQLDRMIAEDGPMHISQLIVHSPGQTSFSGKSIPAIRKYPLIETLDIAQIEHWQRTDGFYPGTNELKIPDRPITSAVLLAETKIVEDKVYADIEKPGVFLSVTYSTGAHLLGDYNDYPYKNIGDLLKEHGNNDNVVGAFATYMYNNGYGLDMPFTSYEVSIGNLSRGRNYFGYGTVDYRNEFLWAQGQFRELE